MLYSLKFTFVKPEEPRFFVKICIIYCRPFYIVTIFCFFLEKCKIFKSDTWSSTGSVFLAVQIHSDSKKSFEASLQTYMLHIKTPMYMYSYLLIFNLYLKPKSWPSSLFHLKQFVWPPVRCKSVSFSTLLLMPKSPAISHRDSA